MKKTLQATSIGMALVSGYALGNYEAPIVYDDTNANHQIARAIDANIAECRKIDCDILQQLIEERDKYLQK